MLGFAKLHDFFMGGGGRFRCFFMGRAADFVGIFLENIDLIVPFSNDNECCIYFLEYALMGIFLGFWMTSAFFISRLANIGVATQKF